jgi:hypothetical protein
MKDHELLAWALISMPTPSDGWSLLDIWDQLGRQINWEDALAKLKELGVVKCTGSEEYDDASWPKYSLSFASRTP